ncbi:MAG: metallophosphoesterase [Lachnospiraceae bacterium]
MSTYVMSDIHGQYKAYEKMLKLIGFSKEDQLYVLGDVIDRGPDGISIIKDLMKRKNAELILGNHEFMLLNAMKFLHDRENGVEFSGDGLNPFELWTHPCNGGEGTCLEYMNFSKELQESIDSYLRSLNVIKRIKIDKTTYHLSHSFSVEKPFGKEIRFAKSSYRQTEKIVWESLFDKPKDYEDPNKLFAYSRDVYVCGHIFTQRLGKMDENGKGKIYKEANYRGYRVIDIDCGMALNSRSSRLGCLCLETGEEYYVPLLEY